MLAVAVVLLAYSGTVNAECQTSCQQLQNTNPNPEPYRRLESLHDDGATRTQKYTTLNDHQIEFTTDVHFGDRCTIGDMIPNENDCTSYYECANGQYELRLCPSGNFYDPRSRCCRPDYSCPNRAYDSRVIVPTTPRPTCNYGEMRADDTNCRNYYMCVGSDLHFERRTCPEGQTFDRQMNRCVTGSAENSCQQQGFIYGKEPKSENIGVGLACTESSGPSGYSADPTDCHRFYQCAQGRWVRMQCPSNLVWNPSATVCDWPKNTLVSCH